MASQVPMHVSLFHIRAGHDHWPFYGTRYDHQVTGGPHDEPIRRAVREGRIPAGTKPTPDPARPERFLDIPESRTGGKCIYAFFLEGDVDRTRLRFVRDRPFIPMPLNFAGDPDFITNCKVEDGANGQWASFTCDLDLVRNSGLARRIKGLTNEHGHPIGKTLTIPFCLNVIDEGVLHASPWAVPRHSHSSAWQERPGHDDDHDHDHDHEDGRGQGHNHAVPPFTHGGVHPPNMSFVEVGLG